jgi:vacuolar-type H+-ATPase subunit F/Vma7
MDFFCIADHDSSLGFRLAGLDTRDVSNKEEADKALQEALSRHGLGIVLITSQAAVFLRAEINKLVYERELPLILEIPSKGGKVEGGGVEGFLKAALGISI